MSAYPKPLPQPDPDSAPFWEGTRAGELRVQRCTDCGTHQYYGRAWCTTCGSLDLDWVAVTGHGVVHSFTVVRRTGAPGFRDEVPYVVALVELDEGPRMLTNVVGCDPAEVRCGARVEVDLTPVTGDVTLPLFRLVSA